MKTWCPLALNDREKISIEEERPLMSGA